MPRLIETYGQWLAAQGAVGAFCSCGCKGSDPIIFSTDEIALGLPLDGGVLYCSGCLGAGRITEMAPIRRAV